MSINIKGTSSKPSQTSSDNASSAGKSNKSAPSSSATTGNVDSVDLTDTASRLQQIEQSLSNIPIVDHHRVEAVSQTIDDGQYQIDNEKIADRIIKNENDLNNLKK
ncbi:MAG TPA: flagellar biosynthesis anti-sigma factor FlgM [Cycloclasticus sp.]|jgi:negative regulator of flagellin synthesis FlgM|nr:flagellar biosynthesis anti-sigma factor FlgM [Cycloclasticus sp.]